MKEERIVTVPLGDDGQRLDRWLKKAVPELPYGLSQKLIRKGAIRIDGRRAKGDAKLAAGQSVRIPAIEDRPEREREVASVSDEDAEFIRSLVIYDDGDVVAFNKPAGLASQGGGGVEWHIDAYFPALADEFSQVPRLIHRLDRDTSGVLLCARSAEAVRRLGKAFKDRHARKIYWAVTIPAPQQNEGTVRAPLAKASGPIKDRMVVDDKEGQTAITDFVVLERAAKRAALVAFWPRTGRTHQIRVHAADVLQCPIMGDEKYAHGQAWLEGMDGLSERLHLHARQLTVTHPGTGKPLVLTAPLPDDLKASWDAFGFDSSSRADPFEDF